jgi:hypothetical protein
MFLKTLLYVRFVLILLKEWLKNMIIRGNVKGDDAKTVTAFEMIFWKIWEFVKNVLLDKIKNNKEEGKSNKG